MPELAGKTNQVYAHGSSMTGATGSKVNSCDNSSFERLCDILEMTHFGDNYKRRKAGLLDTRVPISGNYDPADTGQNLLVAGNSIYVGIYPQGTTVAGSQVQVLVESHTVTADAGGKQVFNAVLVGEGLAPVSLPART